MFIRILQEIMPYIILLIVSFIIEFHIKYRRYKKLNIEDFYIRGIRILILILLAIRLNLYGGIYTILSFILTYIICAILDNRYRKKFETVWIRGNKEIDKYLKVNKKIDFCKWVEIRYFILKKSYVETYNIFRFKSILSIIIIIFMYIIYVSLIR